MTKNKRKKPIYWARYNADGSYCLESLDFVLAEVGPRDGGWEAYVTMGDVVRRFETLKEAKAYCEQRIAKELRAMLACLEEPQ